MRVALVAVALTACASTPRVSSPRDPAALRAGDGRIPVRVTSSGATQNVAVVPAGTRASQGMIVDAWCQTPCTLHLAPGAHALYTGAPTVRDAITPLTLGERSLAVQMRAPTRAHWERGRNLAVGGAGLAALGVIFVAFSPLEVSGGSPTGPETIAVGVGLGALGATLIAVGLRVMGSEPAGAAEVRALDEAGSAGHSSSR